jgi:hypothetical protein
MRHDTQDATKTEKCYHSKLSTSALPDEICPYMAEEEG